MLIFSLINFISRIFGPAPAPVISSSPPREGGAVFAETTGIPVLHFLEGQQWLGGHRANDLFRVWFSMTITR